MLPEQTNGTAPPRPNPPAPRLNPFERFCELLMRIASIVLLTMMLHVTADVLSKLFFNYPIKGTLEIVSYYYMVSAVFLPIALVEMRRSSVQVDALFNLASEPVRVALMALVLLISAAVYAGLVAITLPDALRAFARSEVVMGPVPVPIWPARFILPGSCVIACVACLWTFARCLFDPETRASLIANATVDEATVA